MIARKHILRNTARTAIFRPSSTIHLGPISQANTNTSISLTAIRTYAQGPPGGGGYPSYGSGGPNGPRGPGGPGNPGGPPGGGGGNPFGGMRFPGQTAAPERGEYLKQFSIDLTNLAKKGKLDPVIGRDEEIRRTIQILSRRTKSNPVLLGLPGLSNFPL